MNIIMQTLFTQETLNRIQENVSEDHTQAYRVDLHQLTVAQAHKLLKNIIAANKDACTIKAIHGYHHGTKIRAMIRGDFQNKRVEEIVPDKTNPGATYLKIKKSA